MLGHRESNKYSAHCVLLGPNYDKKKTCLSFDASHFDESYALPGHKAKNLLDVPTWDQ